MERRIKGFHEETNIVYKDNAMSFVKDDDEDCWVEVIPILNLDNYVVQIFEGCERTHTSFTRYSENMWNEINEYVHTFVK